MRGYLFFITEKCRIHAACGVSQTPKYIQEMKGVAHDYTRRLEGIKQMIGTGEAYVSNDIRHYADEMLRHIEESCRFVFTAPTPIHPKKIKKLRP